MVEPYGRMWDVNLKDSLEMKEETEWCRRKPVEVKYCLLRVRHPGEKFDRGVRRPVRVPAATVALFGVALRSETLFILFSLRREP